jgi:16S rRNA (guanine527-N7)-methyltransferase
MRVPGGVDEVFAEAQRLGFLGPAAIASHRRHAETFLAALRPAASVLDLGTGGGLPGLVIAEAWPEATVILLDAREGRTDFLRRAVSRLGWTGRVVVLTGRAEALGHDPDWRATCAGVVARGFGRPGPTAECAAPFLAEGGQLVVSEPPPDGDGAARRWPSARLAELGLRVDDEQPNPTVRSLTQVSPCPDRFARAAARHAPLF